MKVLKYDCYYDYDKTLISYKSWLKNSTVSSFRGLTAPSPPWWRFLVSRTTKLYISFDVCDSVMNLSSAQAIIFVVLQSIDSYSLQSVGSLCTGPWLCNGGKWWAKWYYSSCVFRGSTRLQHNEKHHSRCFTERSTKTTHCCRGSQETGGGNGGNAFLDKRGSCILL